jgi:Protein of unknown function (DUF3047)
MNMRWHLRFGTLLLVLVGTVAMTARAERGSVTIAAAAWRVVQRESGPVNYYSVVSEGGTTFVRSHYVPPLKTVVLGWQVPDADRQTARTLAWTWRARKLPTGGDECAPGKGDSAAVIYVTWKHMLRYYTIKYVWSAVGTKGAVCDKKRNPFVAQDTVVLESGPPLDTWRTTTIDLASEYRKHFGDGDANAAVPDFVGIGIMSDGDQTHSESSADYGSFVLQHG